MQTTFRWMLVAAVGALLTGCVSSKTVLRDVRLEDHQAQLPFKNVLVVARAQSHRNRATVEDNVARYLKGKNTATGVTHKDIPGINPISRAEMKRLAVEGNYDAVIGLFLISMQHPVSYTSMSDFATPFGARPGVTWTTADFVNVKAVLYDVETEALVWSATSRTDRPESLNSTSKQIGQALAEELRRFGYID